MGARSKDFIGKISKKYHGIDRLFMFIHFSFSKIYLFLCPSPWVEYSVAGALDKYQLGFGVWKGKAWGILPSSYDHDRKGARCSRRMGT